MARQAEEIAIVVGHPTGSGLRQFITLANEAGAGAMLESAIAVADSEDLEQVVIDRRAAIGGATKQIDLCLANALQIARETREIGTLSASNRDVVSRAAGVEPREDKRSHLHRMIDELVIVARSIATETVGLRAAARQAGRDAPIATGLYYRRYDIELAWTVLAPDRPRKHACTIEITAHSVEIGRADRKIERINIGGKSKRTGARIGSPDVLGDLLDLYWRLATCAVRRVEVTRELPDQIAAGNPCRRAE